MEVRLHAMLREVARASSLAIDMRPGQSVGDALRAVSATVPALEPWLFRPDGTLGRHVAVILEGRDIRHLAGADTPLSGTEHLDLFPPVGGG